MEDYSKLEYELSPDLQQTLETKVSEDEDFRKVFCANYQKTFFDSIDYRIKRGIPIIISILGLPHSGKTFSALYLAEYISKKSKMNFPSDARNVLFTLGELRDVLTKSKPRETFVEMEGRLLNVGWGCRSLMNEIEDMKRLVITKQNNMIYVAPTLENHLQNFILEPLGINYKKKICRLMAYGNKQNQLGLIYLPAPSSKLAENVEKKEEAFAEKIVNRTMNAMLAEIEKAVADLRDDKEFKKLTNKAKRTFYVAKKYSTLPLQTHELLAELAID